MRTVWKIVKWLGLGLLGVLALLAAAAFLYLRTTLPDYEGEVELAGLSEPVTVIRDSYGMPHIFAANDRDLCFALGYCMAQDRLFQMDLVRRLVRGNLAEILGEPGLPTDRLFRTLTAAKPVDEMVRELPETVRDLLAAFSAGVNAYRTSHSGALPPEFLLLGYEPERWEPSDGVAAYVFMAWGLSFSFETELVAAAIVDRVGEELAREIRIAYPEGYPVISVGPEVLGYVRTASAARELTGMDSPGGSNNWVVSGAKSKTGKPLMASDMHLGHSLPGVWYEAHLNTPQLNVSGVLIPGIPFVVVGMNEDVAWSFTNAMADDTDYYLEKPNPDNPLQVEFAGRWEDVRVRKETIRVKGGAPVELDILLTRHGPVVHDGRGKDPLSARDGKLIALRWAATEFAAPAEAFYLVNRARSLDEIEGALANFKCPGQNWVYADNQGDIGYWAAVGIPVREGFDGALPVPGWDGRYEWKGFVPTADQPHFRNPPEGFIATANNRIAPDGYPHVISNNYATPDRALRIREMLQAQPKLGSEDFMVMHADTTEMLAREWVPRWIPILRKSALTDNEVWALQVLAEWNFVASPDQVAPSVFYATLESMIETLFRKRLGDELYTRYIQGRNRYAVLNALRALAARGDSRWFDDPDTGEVEGFAEVLSGSFRQAVRRLGEEAGDDPEEWTWGRLHTLTLHHPFGRVSRLLGFFFDAGPFPAGGAFATVNPAPYPFSGPRAADAGASMRYILDLADRRRSLRVIPAGISGNPVSPHYDDQIDLWRGGAYRPFLLGRKEVEADQKHVLKLLPHR